MPLTLAHGRDENVNCWGVRILTSPDHSAKHWKGYSEAAAVTWVRRGARNPGRQSRMVSLASVQLRKVSVRYSTAVKANCPLETSLLVLNLLSLRRGCFCLGSQSVLCFFRSR